jgi:hypothetical protein
MTVVCDQRVTVPPGSEAGAATPRSDDEEDVVLSYLERWVQADGPIRLLPSDPCTIGLLAAMSSS